MTTQTISISHDVKKRVMRRIQGIWLFRLLAPVLCIELPLLLLFAKLAADYIFVQKVLQNFATAFSGVGSGVEFFSRAFINSGAATQAILLFGTIAAVWFLRDAVRSFVNIGSLFIKKSI